MAKIKLTNQRIYDTVKEVVGEDSLDIVKYLQNKKNISDFKIAEQVKRDIHEIRNILYRLFNHNLVTYYRKKDRQKGWYISYWTFNKKRIGDLMTHLSTSKLSKFKERLEAEESNVGNFYICPNVCVRLGFEKAFDLEYRCPECGSVLNHQDNTRTIDTIREQIKTLEVNGHRV
jgi:transcription initiation factor TFIIE subunit alpha